MMGIGVEVKGKETKGMRLHCSQAKELFSPYLDGVVTGTQMLGVQGHLSECSDCAKEYESLRRSQQLLMSLPRPKPPADLGLKLRLAASRENARAKQPFQGRLVRLENALHAFMVPATAGFLSAVIIFAFAMAYLFVPVPLRASNDDVPLMVNTAPELEQSAFNMTSSTITPNSLVIEAFIDANGRVQDYRILSDPNDSKQLLPEVKQMLIFTTFRPALSMGEPSPGRAVLSFSKFSGRG
jgi:hypothetical protein